MQNKKEIYSKNHDVYIQKEIKTKGTWDVYTIVEDYVWDSII